MFQYHSTKTTTQKRVRGNHLRFEDIKLTLLSDVMLNWLVVAMMHTSFNVTEAESSPEFTSQPIMTHFFFLSIRFEYVYVRT